MDSFQARVTARREVAGTVHLHVEVPDAVKHSFVAPGQYLHVTVDGLSGPFAPASAPGATGPLELLFKRGTPLTNALAKVHPGTELEVSPATGRGFPLAAAKGRPLLLVASGTGQAPMRSVIDSVRRDRTAFGPVTLVLGVRDTAHLAFADEQQDWEREGIAVHVTLSKGEAAWKGRTGRVQQHLPRQGLEDTVAFVVGQREMVDEVITALQQGGLPRQQLYLNV